MLAVLIADALETGAPPRIALAAPTGKAAARLRETISNALIPKPGEAPIDPEIAKVLGALRPTTMHGLLGSFGPGRQRFRHDATNPLRHDIVVIDEMSMVSLPLMARLLEALQPSTRLVLVGDPGQLDSVENGSILRDLVQIDGGNRRLPLRIGHVDGADDVGQGAGRLGIGRGRRRSAEHTSELQSH